MMVAHLTACLLLLRSHVVHSSNGPCRASVETLIEALKNTDSITNGAVKIALNKAKRVWDANSCLFDADGLETDVSKAASVKAAVQDLENAIGIFSFENFDGDAQISLHFDDETEDQSQENSVARAKRYSCLIIRPTPPVGAFRFYLETVWPGLGPNDALEQTEMVRTALAAETEGPGKISCSKGGVYTQELVNKPATYSLAALVTALEGFGLRYLEEAQILPKQDRCQEAVCSFFRGFQNVSKALDFLNCQALGELQPEQPWAMVCGEFGGEGDSASLPALTAHAFKVSDREALKTHCSHALRKPRPRLGVYALTLDKVWKEERREEQLKKAEDMRLRAGLNEANETCSGQAEDLSHLREILEEEKQWRTVEKDCSAKLKILLREIKGGAKMTEPSYRGWARCAATALKVTALTPPRKNWEIFAKKSLTADLRKLVILYNYRYGKTAL